jgi:hypothetical protein
LNKKRYFNAGVLPGEIIRNNTDFAHLVNDIFGVGYLTHQLYQDENWQEWKKMKTVHLLLNHRYYLDKESPIKEFNEDNIINYKYPYGSMARDIMNKIKLLN